MRIRAGLYFSQFFSRHQLMVWMLDVLLILVLVLLMGTRWLTLAQVLKPWVGVAEIPENKFPYKACFTVTGYYSPLPDQERYGRGSYEAEVIFEGKGTHGADGTAVYVGMLAAPPEIPFGTKIEIPGVGTGTVHDRGGAIKSGESCSSRLDVWMGYGDSGLERALNWGMRKVQVTIYGIDETVAEDIYLEGYSETEKMLREVIPFLSPQLFQQDLGPGDDGDEVARLQKHLKELGYFEDEETGVYDEATTQAVLIFQLYYGVVETPEDFGAGYFGVNTRSKFDFALKTFDEETYGKFTYGLGLGSYGREVRRLQKYLVKLGYLGRDQVTSEFDKNTEKAVLQFQLDHSVVGSASDNGAGYFGPQTREAFNAAIDELDEIWISVIFEDDESSTDNSRDAINRVSTTEEEVAEEEEKIAQDEEKTEDDSETQSPEISAEILAKYPDLQESDDRVASDLTLGMSGDQVFKLQEELRNLGYLRIAPTGYFGEITGHAVFKLQQNWGLVSDENTFGAGYVGPQTSDMINDIIDQRVGTKKLIAAGREDIFIAQSEDLKEVASNVSEAENEEKIVVAGGDALFERELQYGDRGEDVKTLQKKLRKLGFFKGFLLTDYFGDVTRAAVIAYQMEEGIIDSAEDIGAGRVGPETLRKLKG